MCVTLGLVPADVAAEVDMAAVIAHVCGHSARAGSLPSALPCARALSLSTYTLSLVSHMFAAFCMWRYYLTHFFFGGHSLHVHALSLPPQTCLAFPLFLSIRTLSVCGHWFRVEREREEKKEGEDDTCHMSRTYMS